MKTQIQSRFDLQVGEVNKQIKQQQQQQQQQQKTQQQKTKKNQVRDIIRKACA